MHRPHWFYKVVIIVASLSLIAVALAPLIYLVAPQPVIDASPVVEGSVSETSE